MVKLSLEFKSIEELAAFISGKDMSKAVVANEAQVEVPAVITPAQEEAAALTPAQKAAKTRAANKAKKKAEEEALAAQAPVVDVNATAASVMQQPVAETAPAGIDRQSYLDAATSMITEMQTLGVADDQIGVKVQEVFASVGIQPCRVSELDDASLPVVVNAIHAMVEGLKTPATTAPSYI